MDCRRNYSPSRQRRLESDAERCCGRDKHHSDGFYLGLCRLRGTLSPPASATTFRRRAILLRSNDGATVILKFGLEIKNRCSPRVKSRENRASIRKSKPEIKNRCTQEGLNREILASIPKSELEIKNRCRKQHIPRHASCLGCFAWGRERAGSTVAAKAGADAPGGGISLCFCRRGCAAPAFKAATLNVLPRSTSRRHSGKQKRG